MRSLMSIEAECQGTGAAGAPPCREAGKRKRIPLSEPAPGVFELPSLLCAACGSTLVRTSPLPWEA